MFRDGPCITVIDRGAEPTWHLEYEVPVEDITSDPDLVELPDTKTHQFFAVAAHVFARAGKYELLRFDAPLETAQELPLWLSHADLMRVQTAGVDHPTALANIPADASILEDDAELAALFQPITKDRVPITTLQGLRGMTWDLADVPPGTYQILGYIFSPPYNDWAVRPGYLKVIDRQGQGGDGHDNQAAPSGMSGEDAPVLWLDDIAARLFTGQGKHVTGCADAPDGSTLTIGARPATDTAAAYEPLLTDVPIADGHFDACLLNRGQDASLTLKITLTTPSGTMLSAFPAETIDMFSTKASCTENERVCCDPSLAAEDSATVAVASAAPASAATAPVAGMPQPTAAGGAAPSPAEMSMSNSMSTPSDDTGPGPAPATSSAPSEPAQPASASQSGGSCAAAIGESRGDGTPGLLWLAALLATTLSRRYGARVPRHRARP